LTPLGFLERAASVFPDHTAIIHGPLRRSYAEFYARTRRLASALDARGIKRGDTVSTMLANTPAALECHYGVPMTQGVLNTLNTRLDAATIASALVAGCKKLISTAPSRSRPTSSRVGGCTLRTASLPKAVAASVTLAPASM